MTFTRVATRLAFKTVHIDGDPQGRLVRIQQARHEGVVVGYLIRESGAGHPSGLYEVKSAARETLCVGVGMIEAHATLRTYVESLADEVEAEDELAPW